MLNQGVDHVLAILRGMEKFSLPTRGLVCQQTGKVFISPKINFGGYLVTRDLAFRVEKASQSYSSSSLTRSIQIAVD
jgi:hypothetical protein